MTRKRLCGFGQSDDEEFWEEQREQQRERAAEAGYMVGDCSPDDLTCPNLLYVNAYAVDRGRGGPEEGGWYYDAGMPLASVPVRAKPVKEPVGWRLRPVNPQQVDEIRAWLKEAFACLQDPRGRYSAAGGPDVEVFLEECPARPYPQRRPRYE